jgi:hypothetical protein
VYISDPEEEVLIIGGVQVPIIAGELFEFKGNTFAVVFSQYGPNCVNNGVGGAVIVIDIVVADPHCPLAGVNVYTCIPTLDVFIKAGDHVPIIDGELLEFIGNTPGVVF